MARKNLTPIAVSILKGIWRTFAAPAQSKAATFCKIFVAVETITFVLNVAAPDVGVSHLSGAHLWKLCESFADVLLWLLMLGFVRERDEARTALKAPAQTTDERVV